jgi:hypothetical protein
MIVVVLQVGSLLVDEVSRDEVEAEASLFVLANRRLCNLDPRKHHFISETLLSIPASMSYHIGSLLLFRTVSIAACLPTMYHSLVQITCPSTMLGSPLMTAFFSKGPSRNLYAGEE